MPAPESSAASNTASAAPRVHSHSMTSATTGRQISGSEPAERDRTLERDYRIVTRPLTDIVAHRSGRDLTAAEFLADIARCADQLPDAHYAINLCTDRYRFSVAFFAAALRGQTTLLPSQRSTDAIDSIRANYRDCKVLSDSAENDADLLIDLAPGANGVGNGLSLPADHTVAIAFTSGSTGTPQAHPKSWQLLCAGRATHARYLAAHGPASAAGAAQESQPASGLVATVPSWHMYGLEWAMLLPTVAPLTLHCGADFFPGDVIAALDRFDTATSVLISTPVHLRALLKSPAPQQPVATTVSATAPLDDTLTASIESHLVTRMLEIYGCSEIGSLAFRAPALEPGWEFFDLFDLHLHNHELNVRFDLLDAPVTLSDRFASLPANRYRLEGRATDLVKVGGKRESLANLNSVLLSLPGVDDGVVYQPSALGIPGGSDRLAAFVVGNKLDVNELRSQLASRLDPVFVPRPIRLIDALPRDTTSKLKMTALKALVAGFIDG